MKAVNVLLTIFVSLLIAFLVFEGGLRLVGFGTPPSLNQFDPMLGWSKKKDACVVRKTGEFKVTFETNAQGLRDDPTPTEKKPGVFRVMMLGDSFVQGYTVDRDDLFVDQLEGWWDSEQRRVEVINAGTEGYSTDQEALWFREHGQAYRPDVVVVFPYLNDIYWSGQDRYNRYPKPRFAPDGTLETGQLKDPGTLPLAARMAIPKLLNLARAKLQGGHPTGPNFFQPPGAEFPIQKEFAPLLNAEPEFLADALARTKGALKALQADCKAVGARLFVCPIPPETALYADEKAEFVKKYLGNLPDEAWSPMKPVNTFLAMAGDLGIDTMDPRQAFQRRAEEGERLYFKEEWHFNPAGNVAMTDFLHKEFDNRNVFPEDHAALSAGGIPEPARAGGMPTWLAVYGILWLALTILYIGFYRDEPLWQPPLKVAGLLALVFAVVIGGGKLAGLLPPQASQVVILAFVAGILGFVAYKLGRRLGTIAELLKAFTLRGHWYLMPLVVILLTIGSLLVVAASSPLVAPFIYTLF
jgi:hypothetical protein